MKKTQPTPNLIRTFQIEPGLHLVRQTLPPPTQPLQPSNTHHIAVIDCSGSMSMDLPYLVKQLNNRLPSLVTPGDRVSLIWFSGRRECGIILEHEEIAGVKDLARVQQAVSKWLRPVGMTGFVEPMQLVAQLIGVTKLAGSKLPVSLFFMSDGCDNQWSRSEVLDAVAKAAVGIAAATFVEYGFYADRALLAAMAQRAGGTHIFAKTFSDYEPVFDAAMKRSGLTSRRRTESIRADVIEGVVFAIDEKRKELTTFEVKAGEVSLPEDVDTIWYLSPEVLGARGDQQDPAQRVEFERGVYAAISLYATRMKPLIIQPLLGSVGDVSFTKEYSACFGKQRYSLFQARAQRAVFDTSERLKEGYNPNLTPPEDAYTLLDFLEDLVTDGARLMLDHDFEYDAISRVREAAGDAAGLKLTYTKQLDGYPILGLTWNEARANVSMLVKRPGTVDVTERLKTEGGKFDKVPALVPTYSFRNYAVIKDGLVNIGKLTIRVSDHLFERFTQTPGFTLLNSTEMISGQYFFVVDLAQLPIINRKMIRTEIKAATLAEIERDLAVARAKQKVCNALVKELGANEKDESPRLAGQYGDEAADWLASLGITDGGFNLTQTKQAAATDVYVTRELQAEVNAPGWPQSLPTLAKVDEAIAKLEAWKKSPKGKEPMLKGATAVMAAELTRLRALFATMPAAQRKNYIDGAAKAQKALTRSLIFQKARIVFSTIVGNTWFAEFATLDDNKISVNYEGAPMEVVISMREVPVQI